MSNFAGSMPSIKHFRLRRKTTRNHSKQIHQSTSKRKIIRNARHQKSKQTFNLFNLQADTNLFNCRPKASHISTQYERFTTQKSRVIKAYTKLTFKQHSVVRTWPLEIEDKYRTNKQQCPIHVQSTAHGLQQRRSLDHYKVGTLLNAGSARDHDHHPTVAARASASRRTDRDSRHAC